MEIRRAKTNQWQETAAIARMLWPSHEKEELEQEFRVLLQNPDAAVFLVYQGDVLAGFAQCGLRWDYVEGSSSSPVGYLEGILYCPLIADRAWQRRCWQNVRSGADKKGAARWGLIVRWKTVKAGIFIYTADF